ncbi:MAG: PstS family phosphate ABC transporter substrate-binding protein [Rickettsiales bacterium]
MSVYFPKQLTVVTAFITAILVTNPSLARDQIRAVGSSTVYPFVSVAAEQFGKSNKFKTPIIESTGTGGGFKLFCSGVDENTPDINNASRPIKNSERENCKKNGITKVVEVPIGYDGIVLANYKTEPQFELTKEQIFLALAHKIPDKDGKLIDNKYKNWNEIDQSLPKKPISVYGPPPTSGTRDAFLELVMEEACEHFPEFTAAYPDKKQRKKACGLLREDGGYIDAGEDDNMIVQKLISNKDALGIFGYSFLEENQNKIHGSKIDGVLPTMENIEGGLYKVSRSLYVYIKADHVDKIPGIKEFINELVSDAAIGNEGYLTYRGLLPLKKEDLEIARKQAASL